MSTLNKKLGQVSNVSFCTAAGVNRCEKLYTGENGRFSIKVGFKQGSTVNPFQVQYRQRSRWTAANEKKKGAAWTKWGDWKAAAAVGTLVAKDGVCTGTKEADKWNRSNVGVNKKGAYKTCYSFSSSLIGADYDARQFQFRVRRYNAKTKKHGPWVTKTLSVYKRAAIIDETMRRRHAGGLAFDLNMKWDRKGSFQIASIKDADGRELLKDDLSKAGTYDSNRKASSVPAKKDGYRPMRVQVLASELKRKINAGETLGLNVYYKTQDGAKTKLTCTKVRTDDTSINAPRLEVSHDKGSGVVTVNVYKSDGNDLIEEADCSATYTWNGKDYSIKPFKKTLSLKVQSTTAEAAVFKFLPPLGVEVEYEVTLSNDYYSTAKASKSYVVDEDMFVLSKKDGSGVHASMYGDCKLAISTGGMAASGLAHGRSLPVVFFGKGHTSKISLSGKIFERSRYKASAFCKFRYWNSVRNNQNALYLLRCPDGEMYTVAITKVDIGAEVSGIREVAVDMEEVS